MGRDSASGGGWGNAPTVPRPTSMGEGFLSVLAFFVAGGDSRLSPLFFGKKVSEACILSLREEEKYATIRTDRSV